MNTIDIFRRYLFYLAKYVGVCFAFFLLLPTFFYEPIRSGIDPSWQIALHYAFQKNFRFGDEFLYTYGPLGVLSTRLPFEGIRPLLIASDLFVYSSLLFIFLYIGSKVSNYYEIALVILVSFTCGECIYRWDFAYILSFISLFFLFIHLKYNSWFTLIPSLLHAAVAFYVKVNMGLAIAVLFIAAMICMMLRSLYWRRYLFFLVMFISSIFLFATLMNVNLSTYILGSIHMANSYNDIMFLKPTELYILSIAAVITTIFTIVIFRCLPLILSSRRDAIIVTSSFLLFIILFKQSFVRADIQHMKGFMHYSALPISLLVLFGSNTIQNYSKGLLGLTIVFGFSYGAQNFQPGYISERWTGLLTYLSQASTSDLPAPVLEGQSILTNDAQSFVGGKTVDFIPWEISYIKYYNLNYRPRPVIQSFAALDEYLDGVNATMYQSSQAPEVVFFTLGAFDGRYDFFDEPQVKDTLASNYKSIGQSGGHLMLERRSDPIQVNKHLIYTGTSKINKTITLPTSQNQFIYLKAKIRYSSIGKLIRALYQPPELFIRFKFADKTSMTHRLLLPSLSSGVLINKHISRLIDAENFFNNKPELLTDISSIKIFSHDRWGFKPHFSYTLTTASR